MSSSEPSRGAGTCARRAQGACAGAARRQAHALAAIGGLRQIAAPAVPRPAGVGWLAMVALVTAPAVARAHIAMVMPAPRDAKGYDQSLAPCGGLPPGPATQAVAGDKVEVRWRNVIAHPGSYRIALAEAPSGLAAGVLRADIPSPNDTSDMSETVVLPAQACPACILQLVQVNTSRRDAATPSGYVEYVACADLAIAAAPQTPPADADPVPTTTPGTQPAPTSEQPAATPAGSEAPRGGEATPAATDAPPPAPSEAGSSGLLGGCRSAPGPLAAAIAAAVAARAGCARRAAGRHARRRLLADRPRL